MRHARRRAQCAAAGLDIRTQACGRNRGDASRHHKRTGAGPLGNTLTHGVNSTCPLACPPPFLPAPRPPTRLPTRLPPARPVPGGHPPAIGPNMSMVRMNAAVLSMPMVATAVPNRPSALPSTMPALKE